MLVKPAVRALEAGSLRSRCQQGQVPLKGLGRVLPGPPRAWLGSTPPGPLHPPVFPRDCPCVRLCPRAPAHQGGRQLNEAHPDVLAGTRLPPKTVTF